MNGQGEPDPFEDLPIGDASNNEFIASAAPVGTVAAATGENPYALSEADLSTDSEHVQEAWGKGSASEDEESASEDEERASEDGDGSNENDNVGSGDENGDGVEDDDWLDAPIVYDGENAAFLSEAGVPPDYGEGVEYGLDSLMDDLEDASDNEVAAEHNDEVATEQNAIPYGDLLDDLESFPSESDLEQGRRGPYDELLEDLEDVVGEGEAGTAQHERAVSSAAEEIDREGNVQGKDAEGSENMPPGESRISNSDGEESGDLGSVIIHEEGYERKNEDTESWDAIHEQGSDQYPPTTGTVEEDLLSDLVSDTSLVGIVGEGGSKDNEDYNLSEKGDMKALDTDEDDGDDDDDDDDEGRIPDEEGKDDVEGGKVDQLGSVEALFGLNPANPSQEDHKEDVHDEENENEKEDNGQPARAAGWVDDTFSDYSEEGSEQDSESSQDLGELMMPMGDGDEIIGLDDSWGDFKMGESAELGNVAGEENDITLNGVHDEDALDDRQNSIDSSPIYIGEEGENDSTSETSTSMVSREESEERQSRNGFGSRGKSGTGSTSDTVASRRDYAWETPQEYTSSHHSTGSAGGSSPRGTEMNGVVSDVSETRPSRARKGPSFRKMLTRLISPATEENTSDDNDSSFSDSDGESETQPGFVKQPTTIFGGPTIPSRQITYVAYFYLSSSSS